MEDRTSQYAAEAGLDHRRDFGQFFTPFQAASFMARWVLAAPKKPSAIFDPAFGLGVFGVEAKKIEPKVAVAGCEIDPLVLSCWEKRKALSEEAQVANEDYLLRWGEKKGAIVCNPPYMRFQKLKNRDAVFQGFLKNTGIRLSGYTNSASAFLMKSLHELEPKARLAFIMPLEFLNTGYGAVVKKRLLEDGRLKAFIRIKDEKSVFAEALTSIGIILVDGAHSCDSVGFYSITDLNDLEFFEKMEPDSKIAHDGLDADEKWMKLFEPGNRSPAHKDLMKMNHYGSFMRGIATGANDFFALSAVQVKELKLNLKHLTPCITKSNQIKEAVFDDERFESLWRSNEPVMLFDVKGSPDAKALSYIQRGEEQEYHKRFLTSKRTPWYRTEEREPAPLLFGVFSRMGFKAVRNHSRATNLTCYHGFYPNLWGQGYIDRLFLYLRSAAAREILAKDKRVYGGGLDKFEPNDLNGASVPSPEWFNTLGTEEVQQALTALKQKGALPKAMEEKFKVLVS